MDININKHTGSKAHFKMEFKIYDTLQIASNSTSVLLWNKYQLFLYENCNFSSAPIILETSFKIKKAVLDKKYITCLDFDQNVHSISFTRRKSVLGTNVPVVQNIMSFLQLQENIISFRKDCGKYMLCLHEIYNLRNIIKKINLDNIPIAEYEKNIILKGCKITDLNKECVSSFFKKNVSKGFMIFILIGNRFVYCKIIESDCDIATLLIYDAPTGIQDIEICDTNDINLIIGLKTGILIKLQFVERKHKTLYLNIPLQKFIIINNSVFYSDCNTMWKIEDFNRTSFQEVYAKQLSDFVKFKDQIICVTYSKTIHKFLYEDKSIFISSESDEFQPIHRYMVGANLIYDEIKKNEKVLENLEREQLYVTAIALSNQLNIINDSITLTAVVYDSYSEATSNTNIVLTNLLLDYFVPNTALITVNLTFNDEIKDLYTIIDKLKLHITITDGAQTKTIIIGEITFKETFLIPFVNETLDLKLNVKLITPIPNNNESIWTILYYKSVNLTAEHFINANKEQYEINCLRKNTNVQNLILSICEKHHGDLFNFTNHQNINKHFEYSYFIKLPNDFEKFLSDRDKYRNLSKGIQEYLLKIFQNIDSLKQNQLEVSLRGEQVMLQIDKDYTDLFMKITSGNAKLGYQFRNFLYRVLYGVNENLECIPQAEYTALEDLRRRLTTLQCQRVLDEDLLLDIANKFNKRILSRLPM